MAEAFDIIMDADKETSNLTISNVQGKETANIEQNDELYLIYHWH